MGYQNLSEASVIVSIVKRLNGDHPSPHFTFKRTSHTLGLASGMNGEVRNEIPRIWSRKSTPPCAPCSGGGALGWKTATPSCK